jgi:hypothetical protein
MITATVDQTSHARLRPAPVGQPGSRPARARGPLARPVRPAPVPPQQLASNRHLARGSRGVVPPWSNGAARGCRVDPVIRPSAPWRLTDRGIALVLALAAVIVMAAVTVIGLTAWRVTGPGYQATGVSQVSLR